MNRRENFINALAGKPHDYMPANYVIDGFHIPSELPKGFDASVIPEFDDLEEIGELQRYLGLDVHVRIVPRATNEICAGIEQRVECKDGVHKTYIIDFPGGQLTYKGVVTPETEFRVEYGIKKIEDYKLLKQYFDSQHFEVNKNNIETTSSFLRNIGDGGVVYEVIPSTPIMDLIRSWTGLERFIYDLMDEEEVVQSVMEAMERAYLEKVELVAKTTPCKVLVFWDDANSLYLSPGYFQKYCIPIMRKYSEIAHKYGKVLVCHTCGKINAFSKLFLDTGVDAVDWVAPVPVGDINPLELQKIWSSDMTMLLATCPTVFTEGSAADVENHIRQLLNDMDRMGRLGFMMAAQSGTPMDRIRAASNCLIKEFGVPANYSSKYGSILE